MTRWLIITGILPLCAAAAAEAQALRSTPVDLSDASRTRASALNLRITHEFVSDPIPRLTSRIVADTEVMQNGRLGVGLVTATRNRLGFDRSDGRQSRSRKPAVTFVLRF